MRLSLLAALFAACLPAGVAAQTTAPSQSDALAWLQKVQSATHRLSYTGTFVFQYGHQTETSKITRVVEGGGARERLETLDGMPREVLRQGDELVCYLPATMVKRIDRQPGQRSFPAILTERFGDLSEHYVIRKGDVERVAGFDCQVITLEPRDNMRYGYKLWADVATGMLLKARTYDDRGEVLEQFHFTQLQIGGNISRDLLKSRFSSRVRDWKIEDSGAVPARLSDAGWQIRARPPGFRKISEMKRTMEGVPGVGHIVLSDGLSVVSVFIEPGSGKVAAASAARQGAVNVYTRQLGEHRITVVGEAPAESVRLIAHSVEFRRP